MKHTTRWFVLIWSLTVIVARAEVAADFLKVIERPSAPLAPQEETAVVRNGLAHIAFSIAADPRQRIPGILVQPVAPTNAGRRPVVIVLHGTGGTKEGQLPLLTELARAGFVAVAIDAPYHGARSQAGKGSADYQAAILRAYRTGQEHPFFYDTVGDVRRLIDYLASRRDIDDERIGLIGFSKGGIEAYLTAAVDPRIRVVVPCIGVQSFRWALEHNAWQSRVGTIHTAFSAAAKEAGVEQPGAAFVRTFYDRVAPEIYGAFDGPAMLPMIAPRPLLVINGDSDDRTPLPGLNECIEAARAAYRAANAEEKFSVLLQANTGHKVTPEARTAAIAWFVRWLVPSVAD